MHLFRLAHLSDLHATPVRIADVRELAVKRLLGLLSWRRRRLEHRTHVLEALVEDLAGVAPDHVAVTGDLTNLGLTHEFEAAEAWLRLLGEPPRVSVVPGNHDAYVGRPGPATWGHWAAYMSSEPGPGGDPIAPAEDGCPSFPTVRVRGEVALVGLSSARVTAPLLATGRVGRAQRERLEEQLGKLGAAGLFRVVLIHHPPVAADLSRRRQLTDAPELRAVLARAGAELVLHGHTHRSTREEIPGPQGPIPVVGVPSASAVGRRPGRRARYHVYRIEREGPSSVRRFRITCAVRGLDPESGRFVAAEHFALLP